MDFLAMGQDESTLGRALWHSRGKLINFRRYEMGVE